MHLFLGYKPECIYKFCPSLVKVAIFTTNVDAENKTLINHKCVCGALNRHFCQTRVMGWFSYHYYLPISILSNDAKSQVLFPADIV